jgi:hypothetical protein
MISYFSFINHSEVVSNILKLCYILLINISTQSADINISSNDLYNAEHISYVPTLINVFILCIVFYHI